MCLRVLIAGIGLFLLGSTAEAQLFDSSDMIELELHGPISSVIRDVRDREALPMLLRFGDEEVAVEVRIRGKSRVEFCQFPPLRISFVDDTTGTPFEKQGRLKLVTHCMNKPSSKESLLEEFAAYQILNTLTPISYRARLVRIKYHDTDNRLAVSAREQFAFFIESVDELAARTNSQVAKVPHVSRPEVTHAHTALIAVYQYLIGNSDWSLMAPYDEADCCHNINLLQKDDLLYAIPYDFDLTGLVKPAYARQKKFRRGRNPLRRKYVGYCVPRETLEEALVSLRDGREEIYDVIRSIPEVTPKGADSMISYLSDVFRELQSVTDIADELDSRCK